MNDKLHDAMNQIGDVHLYESIRPRRRRVHWISILIAILALALFLLPIIRDRMLQDTPEDATSDPSSYVEPVYNDSDENMDFSYDISI